MKIERMELREIRLPLVAPFETSFGRTTGRRIILVKVFGDGWPGGRMHSRRTSILQPRIHGELLDDHSRLHRADGSGPRDRIAEQVPQLTGKIRGNKMARARSSAPSGIWRRGGKGTAVAIARRNAG